MNAKETAAFRRIICSHFGCKDEQLHKFKIYEATDAEPKRVAILIDNGIKGMPKYTVGWDALMADGSKHEEPEAPKPNAEPVHLEV